MIVSLNYIYIWYCSMGNVLLTEKPIVDLVKFNINKLTMAKDKFCIAYFGIISKIENTKILFSDVTSLISTKRQVELFIEKNEGPILFENISNIVKKSNSKLNKIILCGYSNLVPIFYEIMFYDRLIKEIFTLITTDKVRISYYGVWNKHLAVHKKMIDHLNEFRELLRIRAKTMLKYAKYILKKLVNPEIQDFQSIENSCNVIDDAIRIKLDITRQIGAESSNQNTRHIKGFASQLLKYEAEIHLLPFYKNLSTKNRIIREYTEWCDKTLSNAKSFFNEKQKFFKVITLEDGSSLIDKNCKENITELCAKFTLLAFFIDLTTENDENIVDCKLKSELVKKEIISKTKKKVIRCSHFLKNLKYITSKTHNLYFGKILYKNVFSPAHIINWIEREITIEDLAQRWLYFYYFLIIAFLLFIWFIFYKIWRNIQISTPNLDANNILESECKVDKSEL